MKSVRLNSPEGLLEVANVVAKDIQGEKSAQVALYAWTRILEAVGLHDKENIVEAMASFIHKSGGPDEADLEDLLRETSLTTKSGSIKASVVRRYSNSEQIEAFMEAYPGFSETKDGTFIPLKAASEEEVAKVYNKVIKSDDDHADMMRELHWAVNQGGIISVKITNFLSSQMWRDIRNLRISRRKQSKRGIRNI